MAEDRWGHSRVHDSAEGRVEGWQAWDAFKGLHSRACPPDEAQGQAGGQAGGGLAAAGPRHQQHPTHSQPPYPPPPQPPASFTYAHGCQSHRAADADAYNGPRAEPAVAGGGGGCGGAASHKSDVASALEHHCCSIALDCVLRGVG